MPQKPQNKLPALISALIFILLISTVFSALSLPIIAEEAGEAELDYAINSVIQYCVQATGSDNTQSWLDCELADNAGMTSEWFVMALSQLNESLSFNTYADALLSYLSQNEIASATSRQRCALALIAAGRSNAEYVSATVNDSIGALGIMSYIFGLHLYNNDVRAEGIAVDEIISSILDKRLSDGGWALRGDVSDVDVTAMTLQALAPHYGYDPDVTEAVDGALEFLSSSQTESGGYISFGDENAESAAQVMIALSSLNINPDTDERFCKNGTSVFSALLRYQHSDGYFMHTEGGEYSRGATYQALSALISFKRMIDGLDAFYIFANDEKAEPGDTDITIDNNKESTHSDPQNSSAAEENGVEADTKSEDAQTSAFSFSGYKAWTILIIVTAAFVFCIVMYISGKRKAGNYIFIIAVAAALSFVTLLTNFRSADDYYGSASTEATDETGTVTLSIRCDLIPAEDMPGHISDDGIILSSLQVGISSGDTVFDVLISAVKLNRLHIEYSGSESLAYITAIENIYEFDHGDTSGWIFTVNGELPSVSCGMYAVSDGDIIEFIYSLNLGADIKQTEKIS